MAKYRFECIECDTKFEVTKKRPEKENCPGCGKLVSVVVSNFGFAFTKSSGTSQANTGVHDMDYPTADKAVGRSSEDRWKLMKEREEIKAEARKQGGTHALMRRRVGQAIDYEPMSDIGVDARRKLGKDIQNTTIVTHAKIPKKR